MLQSDSFVEPVVSPAGQACPERAYHLTSTESRFWGLVIGSVVAFLIVLAVSSPLPARGLALPPSWWAVVAAGSVGCGLLSSVVVGHWTRREVRLSPEGLEVRSRGGRVYLAWEEIERLDVHLSPSGREQGVTVIAGDREVLLAAGREWPELIGLLRRHASPAPEAPHDA